MRRSIFVLLSIFLFAALAQAQNTPQPVQDAFNDLNRQLGTSYGTGDIQWTWEEQIYTDRSLACGSTSGLAPETIRGYRVVLTVPNVGAWDYRISYEPALFILCSSPVPAAATIIPGTAFPTMTPANCGAMPSRLVIGQEGRVAGDTPNNLRAVAGASGQYLGEIPAQAIFLVLDGPRCSADGAWWYVNYNGTAGWTLEGQSGTYYLEPMSLVNSQATAAPTVAPLSAAATPIVCNPAMPSRMIVGALGRVTPGIPNNVRAQAGSSGQFLGEIPAEAVFRVLAGPTCASNVAWWQVDFNGLVGWTAEGTDGDYWIEPQFSSIPALALTNLASSRQYANFALINITNLQFDANDAILAVSANTLLRHAAVNGFAAVNNLNWLQNSLSNSATPILALQSVGNVVQWLATQEANGVSVRYSADGLSYQERYLVNLPVSQAIFSPDARYLMLVDNNQAIQVFDTSVGQVVAILPNDSGEAVKQLAFNPDGRVFAAGFSSGFVVWQVNNWAVLSSAFFDSPQNFQGLALNNTHFAFAVASNQDAMAFIVPLTNIDSWPTSGGVRHSGAAVSLALAPDNSFVVLATAKGLEISPIPNNELLVATSLNLSINATVNSILLSPDGRFLAIATASGLQLWGATPTP